MVVQKIIPGAGPADLAALLSDEREVFVVCDKAVCKNGTFCAPTGTGGPAVDKNTPFLYTDGQNGLGRVQNDPVFVHGADGVPELEPGGLSSGALGPEPGLQTREALGPELGLPVDEALRRVLGERLKGWYVLEASEGAKDIGTVMEIERAMMEAGVSRGGLVLSVGGGITTDIGGFAASIYKRGIRFANVPTTLLAMVDAAIGGKTGVNLDGYKNMVGVIRQPEFVYIDPAFLQTLPEREVRCGLAEMLKTFLLSDAGLFEEAVAALPEIPARLILEAGRIKEAIVAEDPFESGRRTILNLGHTFAHAIERCSREPATEDAAAGQGPFAPATEGAASGQGPVAPATEDAAAGQGPVAPDGSSPLAEPASQGPCRRPIPHGEAVAMGIVLACRLSDRLGVSEKDCSLEAYVRGAFRKAGLPVDCPYSISDLSGAMSKDKKASGENVRFVLLEAPGRPVLRDLPVSEVAAAL